MTTNYVDYYETLLEKSEEAYLMALEIVNKPTIKYRTEGFCFFMCNAWELLLKAFIVRDKKNIQAIFFKDKSYRTLSLSDCINKIFTSTTNKTKLNLGHIVQIRNRSTHSVLPEYDYVFAPLFQQNVSNFNRFFIKHFSTFKLNESITPFIALNKVPSKAESPLAIIEDSKEFMESIRNVLSQDGIGQHIQFKITKKDDEADAKFKVDPNAKEVVKIIKAPKDVNRMYPFTFNEAVKIIQESIEITLGPEHGFTSHSFNLISKDHPIKSDEQFCYIFNYSGGIRKYSHLTIDFILESYCYDIPFKNKYKKRVAKP